MPKLAGLEIIQLKRFDDERGFFMERYRKSELANFGIDSDFIQDNYSRSKVGVIRGLHYQHSPAQGKLVSAVRGAIWDVVLDLRSSSSTYGQWEAFELSEKNLKALWVPAGFAHGFCVLGDDDADVIYKVDQPYSPTTENGIAYNDPELKISWPVQNPIVSAKDRILPSLQTYRKHPTFK